MARVRHIGLCPITRRHVSDERQCIGCDMCETETNVAQATEGTVFPLWGWHAKTDMDPRELIQLGIDPPCIDQMDLTLGEIDDEEVDYRILDDNIIPTQEFLRWPREIVESIN